MDKSNQPVVLAPTGTTESFGPEESSLIRLISHNNADCDGNGHCYYKHMPVIHIIWPTVLVSLLLSVLAWSLINRYRRNKLRLSNGSSCDTKRRYFEPLPKYSPEYDTMSQSSVTTPEPAVHRNVPYSPPPYN